MTDQEPSPYRRHLRTHLARFDVPTPGGQVREYSVPIPVDPGVKEAATCPQAIIDTDPEGHGLGVWILASSSTEPGGEYCLYEYGGGIV